MRAPSRSEIVPPESALMNANVGSPGLFSVMTIPVAPAALARDAFSLYVQPPRATSAIAPVNDPAGTEPHSSRLAPGIRPVSTSR
jgi:hypothetical protein